MSEANIAVVKDIYDYFHAGDISGLLALFAEDITWDHRGIGAPDSPKNKLFHGKIGVKTFFDTVSNTQEVLDHDVTDFIASGDKVVAIGFFRARVKETGKEVASDWAQMWTIRDGLVFAWKGFADFTADALAFQQ
jgi:ketosteroid isomerase-like protein